MYSTKVIVIVIVIVKSNSTFQVGIVIISSILGTGKEISGEYFQCGFDVQDIKFLPESVRGKEKR